MFAPHFFCMNNDNVWLSNISIFNLPPFLCAYHLSYSIWNTKLHEYNVIVEVEQSPPDVHEIKSGTRQLKFNS